MMWCWPIQERQHPADRNLGARAFRTLNTLVSGAEQAETNVGSYSLLSRKVAASFLQLPERQRHYLQMLRWMGFKVGYVDVEHQERFQGQSSYTLCKLVRHALHGSVSQSKRLLHFSLGLGAAYVVAAFLTVIYIVIRWALWGMKEGWPSTAVLIMASTGCIMLTLGILGLYIGAILEEVRARPLYIIDENNRQFGLMSAIDAVREYYEAKLREHGSHSGVDWNGEASQRVRFNALSKVIPELAASAFSVDDYGCGYGAYLDYLHERGFERLDYLGLDISQEMVDEVGGCIPTGRLKWAAGALGSPTMPWPAGFLMWCRIRNAPRGSGTLWIRLMRCILPRSEALLSTA